MIYIGVDEFRRIVETLQERDIDFEVLEHEEVETSQEAADVRGVELKTGVKAMVFKERNDDEFVMALVPANRRVDVESLEELTGCEVELASPKEVKERTGCKVGSVPPFGFKKPLRTFLDPKVFENQKVNFNAGLRARSIQVKANDLEVVLNAKRADIAES